jgi:Skp family chaperone for outer membrane proteins
MRNIRDLMAYGTLATLILLQIAQGSAFESAQGAARSNADKTILGPADFIELVDENGEVVKLRAAKGRIAWSDHISGRTLSVAFVRSIDVIQKAMDTEEVREIVKVQNEKSEKAYRELMTKHEDVQKRIEGLSPSDPKYQEIYEEYQTAVSAYKSASEDAKKERNRMHVDALKKADADFHAAIEVVTKRLGIDVVFRAESPNRKIDEDYTHAGWDLQAQAVIQYPEAMDITVEVCQEMGITLEPE